MHYTCSNDKGFLRRDAIDRLMHPAVLLPIVIAMIVIGALWPYPDELPNAGASAPVAPAPSLTRLEETGRRLYLSICSYCHGPAGDGFGVNAPNLAVPPRDHTDAAYMRTVTGDDLFAIIKLGGAGRNKSALMPPWGGRLSDREIAALVAYVQTLSMLGPAPGPNEPRH
ncbi:MAG: cytochrome c [Acidobacteria bacterium]|nr:cytochrome c [Acidobacteriota bacterium]